MVTLSIKELKEMFKGEYDNIEIYSPVGVGKHYPSFFHTDNCNFLDETYSDSTRIGLYELMGEGEYNNSIMANASEYINFSECYGKKNAKILCLMLANTPIYKGEYEDGEVFFYNCGDDKEALSEAREGEKEYGALYHLFEVDEIHNILRKL